MPMPNRITTGVDIESLVKLYDTLPVEVGAPVPPVDAAPVVVETLPTTPLKLSIQRDTVYVVLGSGVMVYPITFRSSTTPAMSMA
jgi:hypothetical protein